MVKLPTSKLGRASLAVGCAALAAVIGAGAVYLLHEPADTGVDSARIPQIRQSFPAGFEFREGQRTVNLATINSMNKPPEGKVRPVACAAQQAEGNDILLGATVHGVNAYGHGLLYVISAQDLPPSSKPHQDAPVDCSYTNTTFPDGYAITTPAESPDVSGLKVEGFHTVTKRSGAVTDTYQYKTWIDGHHAVTLIVNSDPAANPPSNPVDPTLARQLFAESVVLVRGR